MFLLQEELQPKTNIKTVILADNFYNNEVHFFSRKIRTEIF